MVTPWYMHVVVRNVQISGEFWKWPMSTLDDILRRVGEILKSLVLVRPWGLMRQCIVLCEDAQRSNEATTGVSSITCSSLIHPPDQIIWTYLHRILRVGSSWGDGRKGMLLLLLSRLLREIVYNVVFPFSSRMNILEKLVSSRTRYEVYI